jgi:formate-dependent nitrite reductase membrane component NrfD
MRFLNMLRVFRPTSPMNVGAWILTFSGGAFTGAFLLAETGFAVPAGLAAGVLGTALATYTGVLVGNTAVPLWNSSRVSLPILFGTSAITSVGSLFELIGPTPETRLFGNVGRVCELAASVAMEHEASEVEYVARPLKRGLSGTMWRAAALLTGTSLAASLLPKQNRGTQLAAGILGTLGSLLIRFAVEHAGNTSARDPRATFRQQRSLRAD